MKATEFCNFFEFTIIEEHGVIDSKGRDQEGNLVDPYGFYEGAYNYRISDDQGTFSNRYIQEVSELTECFDSMLQDYVNNTIEEYGFEDDAKSEKTYYEQALEWIDEKCPDLQNTDTREVIECLVHPEKIVDDLVKDMSMER